MPAGRRSAGTPRQSRHPARTTSGPGGGGAATAPPPAGLNPGQHAGWPRWAYAWRIVERPVRAVDGPRAEPAASTFRQQLESLYSISIEIARLHEMPQVL